MPDKTIPRQVVYKTFTGSPGACPRCGGQLVNEYCSYAAETRRGKRMADSFIIGGDFGWFCTACPTVVLDENLVGEMLGLRKRGWNVGPEYRVLGIVDLDAIPADKRRLPIGDHRNPLPLILFEDPPQATQPAV
jgi:hypothetical protein